MSVPKALIKVGSGCIKGAGIAGGLPLGRRNPEGMDSTLCRVQFHRSVEVSAWTCEKRGQALH